MKPFPLLITMLSLTTLVPGLTRAEPVEVGVAAPVVSATDHLGETINLGDLYQKGLVLVYFYPKADSPGCTKQACSLRDSYEALTKRGVTVVGVSLDSVAAQKAFHDKFSLPFILLADTDKTVVKAFGVPTTFGFASRQAFLIKDGKIVWRDLKASTAKQAADVLAALDAMKTPAG